MGGDRIRLFTGAECNNACRFCDQGDLKSAKPEAPSLKELVALLPNNVESLQFTGGEVTLRPDELLDAISDSHSLGIGNIRIQSNGRMLAYGNLVERLKEAGLNGADISLHGAQPKSHDWITQAPNSFRQAIGGIRKAVQSGLNVAVHMVLIKSNFREAADLVKLCAKLGVTEIHFRMVTSEGWAAEEAAQPALMPKFSLVLPYVGRAVLRAKRAGIDVQLHDFPICQSGSLTSFISDKECEWLGLTEEQWVRAERVHPEPCASCDLKADCVGLTTAYNDYYGNADLVPIQVESESKKKRA